MVRLNLLEIQIGSLVLDKLCIYLDDEGKIITLPLLWSIHMMSSGSVFGWKTQGYFESPNPYFARNNNKITKHFVPQNVTDNTILNYLGNVFHFLEYINEIHKTNNTPSVHHTELITSRFVNHYLNEVLPQKLQSSKSLGAHQSAISAYLNFLFELEISKFVPSMIYRKTNKLMAEKDQRLKKINYVSRSERIEMLRLCKSERDKLILRMGFEVGLRTSENTGLTLETFKARNVSQKGLLALFHEMDQKPTKQSFEFVLNGKYTKGGKTRNIYFSKNLLSAMKRYYETERQTTLRPSNQRCDTLFVRNDPVGAGQKISKSHASSLFNKIRLQIKHMNQSLSYHDLRHTFATELYHSELMDSEGHETHSESAALIVVSERLGHKGVATTKRYIRLKQQMFIIEGANENTAL